MHETLLTAGEFAKLARTTKRTVLWYAEAGILLPHKVDESGYRWYRLGQILDFQSVLLMRKLGFSVNEIASLLGKEQSMQRLFEKQRGLLEQQIGHLQRMLADTNRYYNNLSATGTLVRPEVKPVKSFDMLYLEKTGPYARIKDYVQEFRAAFTSFPDDTECLTAFVDPGYHPARARMYIGAKQHPNLHPKPGAKIERQTVPAYTALTYTHQGSTTLLSLLWQELGAYRLRHHYSPNPTLPFACVEFYALDTAPYPDPDDSLVTTLHLPIKP